MAFNETSKIVLTALLTSLPLLTIIGLLSYHLYRSRQRVRFLETRIGNIERSSTPLTSSYYRRSTGLSSTFKAAITRDSIITSPSSYHQILRSTASSPSLPTYHFRDRSRSYSSQSPIAIQDEDDKIFVNISSQPIILTHSPTPSTTINTDITTNTTTTITKIPRKSSDILDKFDPDLIEEESEASESIDDLHQRYVSTKRPCSETSSLITDAPSKSRPDSFTSEAYRRDYEKLRAVRFEELNKLVKQKGMISPSGRARMSLGVSPIEIPEGSRGERRGPNQSGPVELGGEGAVRVDSGASWYHDDGM